MIALTSQTQCRAPRRHIECIDPLLTTAPTLFLLRTFFTITVIALRSILLGFTSYVMSYYFINICVKYQ